MKKLITTAFLMVLASVSYGQVPDRLLLKCEFVELGEGFDYYEEAEWINVLIFRVDGEHRFDTDPTWKREEQMERASAMTLEEVLEIDVSALLESILEGETLDPEFFQFVNFSVDKITLFQAPERGGSIYGTRHEINRNSGVITRFSWEAGDNKVDYRAQCLEQSVRELENAMRRSLGYIEEEVRRRMRGNIF